MAKYHVSGTFTSDAYAYDLEANSQAEAIEKFKIIIGGQVIGIDGVGSIDWQTVEAADAYCDGVQELVRMVYGNETPPLRVIGMPSRTWNVGESPIKLRKVQVDFFGSIKSMVCLQLNDKTYIPTSQKGGAVDLLWDKDDDTDNILDKFWVGDNETISFSPRFGFFILATFNHETKLGERVSYIRSIIDENVCIDSADNKCVVLVSSDKKSIYTAWYASEDEIKPLGLHLHKSTSIPIV